MSDPQASSESANPEQVQRNLEDNIRNKKTEKVLLEREFSKLNQRGIKRKADLVRRSEVEGELDMMSKVLGQLKNKLRLMKRKKLDR